MEEESKAVQEIAKTTGKAIDETSRLLQFLGKVFRVPLEVTSDILKNKLEFIKWKQQVMLADKTMHILEERKATGKFKAIPPKLAINILEGASYETDNDLHDKWAQLLANALDPNCTMKVKTAYTDILKSLDHIDAKVLEFLYGQYCKDITRKKSELNKSVIGYFLSTDPNSFYWGTDLVSKHFNLSDMEANAVIDNLIRVRLVTPWIEEDVLKVPEHTYESTSLYSDYESDESFPVTYYHGYEHICLTPLGILFIESCTGESLGKLRDQFENKRKEYDKLPDQEKYKVLKAAISVLSAQFDVNITIDDTTQQPNKSNSTDAKSRAAD